MCDSLRFRRFCWEPEVAGGGGGGGGGLVVGKNECQLAGIRCRSGNPSRIVTNSQGDCLGSTNALHRVSSQSIGWIGKQTDGHAIFIRHDVN